MANEKSTRGTTRIVEQADLPTLARQVRLGAGLTQQEVADRLGVTDATISRAESDGSGRFLRTQRRILEEIGTCRLRGPLWEITEPAS